MQVDFSGRVAVVTGATRGIGREVAQFLAEANARVIVVARRRDEVKAVAQTLPGKGHIGMNADFDDPKSVDLLTTALAEQGRIDVLINNAGTNRHSQIDSYLDADWSTIQRVNLEAPMRLIRAVVPGMKHQDYGRIVNVASIFGVVSKERRALYSASKFGLRGLTVAVAHDVAKHGILVNTVSPGFVQTALTDRMLTADEQAELANAVPMGRFATTDEIARVILFMASSLNTYITGQNIVIDGGFVSG